MLLCTCKRLGATQRRLAQSARLFKRTPTATEGNLGAVKDGAKNATPFKEPFFLVIAVLLESFQKERKATNLVRNSRPPS